MTARGLQSYQRPLSAAIALGDITPNPGAAGAVAYSTTTGGFVRWSGTAWASAAGPSPALLTAVYTTGVLGNGGSETGTVTLATAYRLVAVQTSAAARVRLYTTAAARAADTARVAGVDPGYNAGNVLDLLTTDGTRYELTPEVEAHNREAAPTAAIPLTVTATAAGTITVTFTYVAEA